MSEQKSKKPSKSNGRFVMHLVAADYAALDFLQGRTKRVTIQDIVRDALRLLGEVLPHAIKGSSFVMVNDTAKEQVELLPPLVQSTSSLSFEERFEFSESTLPERLDMRLSKDEYQFLEDLVYRQKIWRYKKDVVRCALAFFYQCTIWTERGFSLYVEGEHGRTRIVLNIPSTEGGPLPSHDVSPRKMNREAARRIGTESLRVSWEAIDSSEPNMFHSVSELRVFVERIQSLATSGLEDDAVYELEKKYRECSDDGFSRYASEHFSASSRLNHRVEVPPELLPILWRSPIAISCASVLRFRGDAVLFSRPLYENALNHPPIWIRRLVSEYEVELPSLFGIQPEPS